MSESRLDRIINKKNLEKINAFSQRLIGARMSYRQIPTQTNHPELAEDEIANFYGHYRNIKMELGEICWEPSFASYYLAKEALQKAFGANGGPEMAGFMSTSGQNGGLPAVIDVMFNKMFEEDIDEFIELELIRPHIVISDTDALHGLMQEIKKKYCGDNKYGEVFWADSASYIDIIKIVIKSQIDFQLA